MKNPVGNIITPTFWYLATVFRSHPLGLERAYREACELSDYLFLQGVPHYCPIEVGWNKTERNLGAIDHVDNEFWLKKNMPFIRAASGLIVAKQPNWDISEGVSQETDIFKRANKRVVYWDLIFRKK